MGQYLPVIVLMVLAILFGVGSFLASGLLAPYKPNSAKEAPYECGIVPSRDCGSGGDGWDTKRTPTRNAC